MNTKTRNIIMYVVLGVLFLVATGATIYAVVMHYKTLGTDEHFSENENGFMEDWHQWEQSDLPLRLSTNLYQPQENVEQAIDSHISGIALRAARRWNEDTGVDLFGTEFMEDGVRAHIWIDIGVPAEPGWLDPGGTAEIITEPDGSKTCLIQTSNTGTDEILSYVILHELGHCLGLAHDDWEGSIMRRTQSNAPDLRDAPRISDHDRALLRNRYGGQ